MNKKFEYDLDLNYFMTSEELAKKIGKNSLFFYDKMLVLKNDNFLEQFDSKNNVFITGQTRSFPINTQFLKYILDNNGIYNYLVQNVKDGFTPALSLININNNKSIKYSITELVTAMNQTVESKKLRLINGTERQRLKELNYLCSLDKKFSSNNVNSYSIDIDGKMLSFSDNKLLSILLMDDYLFDKFLHDDLSLFKEYDVKEYCYALNDYIHSSRLLDYYLLDNKSLNRLKKIENLEIVDFESLNKVKDTNDLVGGVQASELIQVNKDLKKAIFDGMDPKYSNIEKAIYIYIKMCNLLTYDQEFYADEQRGLSALKHESIGHIAEISPTNNNVVCYEFTGIYSKLLSELGISYSVDKAISSEYGKGHSNLTIRSGEYIVVCDAAKGIIKGDIATSKINERLMGIVCTNKNETTRLKFNDMLFKIYKNIIDYKKETEAYKRSIEEYHSLNQGTRSLPLHKRVFIFLSNVSIIGLKGVDGLSYQKRIFNKLFTKKEIDDRVVTINILRSNIDSTSDFKHVPITIFSVFSDHGYCYYKINLNESNPLSTINTDELTSLLKQRKYEILEKQSTIPGTESVPYVR